MLMEYIQEKAKEGDHVLAVDKEVTEKDRFAQGKFSSYFSTSDCTIR